MIIQGYNWKSLDFLGNPAKFWEIQGDPGLSGNPRNFQVYPGHCESIKTHLQFTMNLAIYDDQQHAQAPEGYNQNKDFCLGAVCSCGTGMR